jgi:hypothetical protein
MSLSVQGSTRALVLAATSLIASCTGADIAPRAERGERGEHSEIKQEILTGSRVSPAVVLGQRSTVALLADGALANRSCAPSARDLTAVAAVVDAAATDAGRQLVTLLVACALPADTTLTVAGTEVAFLGEVGVAPAWARQELRDDERRWVTSCALAKMSGVAVEVPISLRGPRAALRADTDERDGWTVEEGAFYGNVFVPVDEPLRWTACRGTGQIQNPSSGTIASRVCATPDPARPGKTLCGFDFAGDCDDVCQRTGTGGARHHCQDARGVITRQVITVYLAP